MVTHDLQVTFTDDRLNAQIQLRRVQNDLDRFHLAGDVVDRVPRLQRVGAHFKQFLRNKLVDHKQYVDDRGDDMPEIKNWKWPY